MNHTEIDCEPHLKSWTRVEQFIPWKGSWYTCIESMLQPLGHRWHLFVSPAACSPPAELAAPAGWTRCGLHIGQPRYCRQGRDQPSGHHSAWWCTPALHQTGTQKSLGPLSPWPPASLPDDISSLMQKGERMPSNKIWWSFEQIQVNWIDLW